MPRQRENSTVSAILAVTKAIRVESDPNKSDEEKQVAINQAMDTVENSNVLASAQLEDERIQAIDEIEAAEAERADEALEARQAEQAENLTIEEAEAENQQAIEDENNDEIPE